MILRALRRWLARLLPTRNASRPPDLARTLERIAAGQCLNFHNDGAPFMIRENSLPSRPAGYYREFVHPTPGISGPGPRRIILGENGEIYLTTDHYKTFSRLQ